LAHNPFEKDRLHDVKISNKRAPQSKKTNPAKVSANTTEKSNPCPAAELGLNGVVGCAGGTTELELATTAAAGVGATWGVRVCVEQTGQV